VQKRRTAMTTMKTTLATMTTTLATMTTTLVMTIFDFFYLSTLYNFI
jgi:hypothetical protein